MKLKLQIEILYLLSESFVYNEKAMYLAFC